MLQAVHPGAAGQGVRLRIDNPDDDVAPTAWQGPIHVAVGSTRCDFVLEDGIISGPFFSDGRDRLFYGSYSGSEQRVRLLSISQCRLVWSSRVFTVGTFAAHGPGELRVSGRRVRLRRDCMPTEPSGR